MSKVSAGKILILPKGDWGAESTYQILDLVNHNGFSWLSKVNNNVNHEPTEESTTFWQKLLSITEEKNADIEPENQPLNSYWIKEYE